MRKGQKASPETVARQKLTKANWTKAQREQMAARLGKSYTKEKRKVAVAKSIQTKQNWSVAQREAWRNKIRAFNLGITVEELPAYDAQQTAIRKTEFVCPRCHTSFIATGGQHRRLRENPEAMWVPCCSPGCTTSYRQINATDKQKKAVSSVRSANTKVIQDSRTKEERSAIARKGHVNRDYAQVRATWDSKSPEDLTRIFKQRVATGRKNGNFTGTSKVEDQAYELLVAAFGTVLRQHADNRYPYPCDFYIPKYDTFVEFHGFWVHGGEPFDPSSLKHLRKLKSWRAKKHTMYDAAIKAWTLRDPRKVEAAKAARLNFYRFYTLADLTQWIYIVKRRVTLSPTPLRDSWFSKLSKINAGRIVKHFQFYGFHHRELTAWSKLATRVKLYANRQTWVNKQPATISDQSILTGLNLAGLATGYSSFDPSWLHTFVEITGCRRIYDPCGGWGHRMLAAASVHVDYIYNDVNTQTAIAARDMKAWVAQKTSADLWVGNNDAAKVSRKTLARLAPDAVFTCPPYHAAEWYSEEGAENLSKEDFDLWWSSVVKSFPSSVKNVGLVIPSSMLETFSQGLRVRKVIELRRTSVFRTNKTRSREVLVLGNLA